MADSINIVFPKEAIKSIQDGDKQIQALNKSYSELLEKITSGAAVLKKSEKTQTNLNKHQKATTQITRELTGLEKQRISVQKQQQTTLAKILVAREKSNKILQKGKIRLQEETRETKLSIVANKALTGSYEKIQAELSKNLVKWKKLSQEERENTTAGKKLTATINSQNTALKKLDTSIGNSQRNVGNYKQSVIGAGKSLLSAFGIVGGVTTAVGLFTRALKGAIATNIEFEKTFTPILGLLDKAEKKEWGGFLKKGAIDIIREYGFETADVNEALFQTISNGVDAGNSIEFLSKSSKLAIAGNAELSSVVKGATKVFEVYKDEVTDIDQILNAFFVAQVKGATDVESLASNIGKVASIAKFAGIPINELFGTFAGLTKFLDGTEESATALTATITALLKVKPGTDQAKAFEELGIEFGATAIQSNGLLNTLLQVADAAETDSDKLSVLIPNVRALKGIAGLTAESIAEIEKNIIGLNDTEQSTLTVQSALTEQLETQDKRAKDLSGSWRALNLEITQNNTGLKNATTGLANAIDWFAKFAKANNDSEKATKANNLQQLSLLKNWVTSIPIIARLVGEKEKVVEVNKEVVKSEEDIRKEAEAKAEADKKAKEAKAKIDKAKAIKLAKEQAEAVYQAKKEFNILTDIEIYQHEREQMVQNKNFAILTQEEQNAALEELAKKDPRVIAAKAASDRLKEDAKIQQNIIEELAKKIADAYKKDDTDEDVSDEDAILNDDDINDYIAELVKANDEEVRLAKEKADELKKIQDEELEHKLQNIELGTQAALLATGLLFDNAQAKREEESSAVQQEYDAKIAKLDEQKEAGIISDEEYNSKKQAAEEARIAKENELKTKEAKANKKRALFEIAINTASAILKATSQTGVLAPFVIPGIIASGAIQAAAVLAAKIPKFKEGTKGKSNTPDTFITSEKGAGTELIEKAGKLFVTTEPTLHTNAKGSRVYSNRELQGMMSKGGGYDSKEIVDTLKSELGKNTRAIKNQKQLIISNGKAVGYSTNHYTRKYTERMCE